MAKGKSHLKEWYVVLVFGVLIGSVLGFAGAHLFSIAAPNTATQDIPCGTYGGFGATLSTTTAGGQFPIQSGENTVGNGIAASPGEIFEKTNYFYSWTAQGQGEAIVVEGRLLGCGGIAGTVTGYRYAFFISTDGGLHWDPFKQSDLGGPDGNELSWMNSQEAGSFPCLPSQNQQWCINSGAFNMPTSIIRIHGINYLDASGTSKPIIDGAWLKVVIQVQANQWFDLAYDIAQLHSALPTVNWKAHLYAVGQTATLHYYLPVTLINNGTAYFLTVTNEVTGQTVGAYNLYPLSNPSANIDIPVTADMFAPNADDRLNAKIYSQIFAAAQEDAATIDNTSLAPVLNSVTFNQPFYREGELVVINISASPNAITQSPIVRYFVHAYIGGTDVYEGFTNASTVSFTATTAGVLSVQAQAYDATGRSSANPPYRTNVGAAIGLCVQYPNLPECNGGGGGFKVPDYWWYATLILLGLGLTFLLVGLYGLPKGSRFKPILVGAGVIMTLAGVAMALAALINFIYFAINKVLWLRW